MPSMELLQFLGGRNVKYEMEYIGKISWAFGWLGSGVWAWLIQQSREN